MHRRPGISWDEHLRPESVRGAGGLLEVLASAQKNLTDFPVLRHLAMREDQIDPDCRIWRINLLRSIEYFSSTCIGLFALVRLPGRFQPFTCRNWCEAASSAPSSSSETRITVARTLAKEELQVI